MADKMTLEQAVEEMRDCLAEDHISQRGVVGAHNVVCWIDAIDAHIAAMGEPVAWLRNDAAVARPDLHVITTAIRDIWTKVNAQHVERYTIPLFRAPPASGDWDKVREVIAELIGYCETSDDSCYGTLSTSLVRNYTDRLTAALPESQS